MSPANQPRWGFIAFVSLVGMLIAAVVVFIVAEDMRWLAFVIAGVGVLDAWFLASVMPKLSGGTMKSQLDQLNEQAEAEAEADDSWGFDAAAAEAEREAQAEADRPPDTG